MLREIDERLRNGSMVSTLKPAKDGIKPDSYKLVNLLSNNRRLISLIILKRINLQIEASMLPSQNVYKTGRSTDDTVLAHKYLLAGSSAKRIQKVCAGIDMSKAFNTLDRKNLMDLLRKRSNEEENVSIIKRLLSQITLKAKKVNQ